MRLRSFSLRTAKEILRDPLTVAFGIGFPLVLLLLLSAIQANIPVALFELNRLTPGITVFGLAFLSLFSATLISKDRESAFLQRLYATPLKPIEYILGYLLPILPMGFAQGGICYVAALCMGLTPTVNILFSLLLLFPISLFFISLGLLCGSVMNSKQVGGICGALLTNLTAWLSGVWFDLELVGDTFGAIAHALPFVHAVKVEQAALSGDLSAILPHLWPVLIWTTASTVGAILFFFRQMKNH